MGNILLDCADLHVLMSQKSLTYIIILMGVSLLGIGSLQWYWVQEGFAAKNREFEQRVQTALGGVVTELAEKETERLLENELEVESIPSIRVLLDHKKDFIAGTDSLIQGVVVRKNSHNVVWDSEEVEVTTLDSVLRQEGGLDSGVGFVMNKTVIGNGEVILDTVIEGDALQYRTKVFGEAMKSLFIKDLSTEEDIENRLEGVPVDSLLTAHLAGQGVNLPFEYAVLGEDGTYAQATENLESLPDDAYRKPVFAFSQNKAQLMLHFPNKGLFVVKSLGWVLVSVIVFSLIMLVTFGITLFYILRQKRISTIKSDFISNMTHEFKTPLATIGLAVDSMRHPAVKGDEEQMEHFAGLIKNEKKRLNGHIEKILQLAKMERGELQLKPEQLDLKALADEAIKSMELQATSRGGSIQIEAEVASAEVRGDRLHLFNAIVNLLDNAIKYCEKPPEIVLSLGTIAQGAFVQVKDNGIGMSTEEQKRVFDTFYRVQSGDVHTVKGFGLGLSYVREIVSLHKGEMLLQSQKGQGSIIGFKLPEQ